MMFVGTLILMPYLIVRIPEDYFIRRPVLDWTGRHPLLHIVLVILKNLLGGILLLAGVAMLLLPGQGLLTILMGLLMIDFPNKRRWEARLFRVKSVQNAANWIRRRYGHPPLKLNTDEQSGFQK